MFQAWVAPPYSLAATLLAIVTWGFTTYWINSYWGGAVPALGGALIIGAVPRLAQRIHLAPVLAATTGAVLLANSRPYEGSLTVLSSAAVLGWWMRREKRPLTLLLDRRVLLPVAAIGVPVLLAMGYYNFRTTGKATRLPYAVNQEAYAASPQFYFLPPPPIPAYRHEAIRQLWVDWDRQLYLAAHHNPLAPWKFSATFLLPFYVLNLLGLAALAGLFIGKRSTVLPALGILALAMLGVMLEKSILAHYLAPMCGVWLILAAAAMEACGARGRAGGMVVAMVLAVAIGASVSEVAGQARMAPPAPGGLDTRPRLIANLERQGGRHLILVRYTPAHSAHNEWVYNDADIDGSPVVWARDMGEEKNRELLDYYKDSRSRHIWLLEADAPHPDLQPYPNNP